MKDAYKALEWKHMIRIYIQTYETKYDSKILLIETKLYKITCLWKVVLFIVKASNMLFCPKCSFILDERICCLAADGCAKLFF